MAISSLFSSPSPISHSLSQPELHLSSSLIRGPSAVIGFRPLKLRDPLRAPSTSSPVVEDGLPPAQSDYPTEDGNKVPFRCKACGREEIERGCNGEGRIQGGIATVLGFGWWPIKAYRPCPGFVASGGRYFDVARAWTRLPLEEEGLQLMGTVMVNLSQARIGAILRDLRGSL